MLIETLEKFKMRRLFKKIEKMFNNGCIDLLFVETFSGVKVKKCLRLSKNEYEILKKLCQENGIKICTDWSQEKKVYIFGFY